MAQLEFTLRYGGTAMDDGRMDVRELAPALLSLADMYQEANAILRPEAPPVFLEFKATEPGSFETVLVLAEANPLQWASGLFTGEGAAALGVLHAYVLGGQFSVFNFIKWLRGSLQFTREAVEPGTTRITLPDGTSGEWPTETVKLGQSAVMRTRARRVIHPLRQDGVDSIEVIEESEVVFSLVDDDREAFNAMPPLSQIEPIAQDESLMSLTVVKPNLEGPTGWRFNSPWRAFTARIEDEAFMAEIDRGEKFAKGDTLVARVRVDQIPGKKQPKVFVTQVLDHQHAITDASRQGALDLE